MKRVPRPVLLGIIVFLLALPTVQAYRMAWDFSLSGQDAQVAWQEGERLAQGENPYSRIRDSDMRSNEKYATYLPGYYLCSAVLYKFGVVTFDSFLHFWRPVCYVAYLLLGIGLFVVCRRTSIAFACFAICFWFYNRWTLHVLQIAHLDTIALALWIASLCCLDQKRFKAWAYLLFGLSLTVKQMALFAVPLYLIWAWQDGERSGAWARVIKALALIVAIPLLCSLPFLVWDANSFVKSFLFSGTRNPDGHIAVRSVGAVFKDGGILARAPMFGLLALFYAATAQARINRYAASLVIVAIVLDFNPVLFNQYMVWAVPFLSLVVQECSPPSSNGSVSPVASSP